jgi:hypothetical protein
MSPSSATSSSRVTAARREFFENAHYGIVFPNVPFTGPLCGPTW